MKYIVFLGDGMADYPVKDLDGKTPLMVANTPAMDEIASKGQCGLLQTMLDDMPTGSAVANLAVLGYDPRKTFQGRGVLEAASMGVNLNDTDIALRVNLICVEDEKIRSHSAGHISDTEAGILVSDLQKHFENKNFKIYQGLSYRHLLIVSNGKADIETFPPHDNVGTPYLQLLVKENSVKSKETAALLNDMIESSYKFLQQHPLNKKRIEQGKQAANMLWPWSPGKKPDMQTFEQRFNIKGAAISAVDLIKGLAIYAGMDVINVEGATGLYDTNFEGKADACIKALDDHDFVFVHVEAADEAGHDKNTKLKIQCIQDLDNRLISRVMKHIKKNNMDVVLALLPDHATPVEFGNHVRDAVPVAIYKPGVNADTVKSYDEESVKQGSLGTMVKDEFIKKVFSKI